MSQALYRKYRPQTFKEVIGQEHILQTLMNQLKNKKFSHAYLFCGPRGIGKTTLARLMAKSVNCLNSVNGEPCNVCKSCEMINKNKALDIIEMDAASNTGVDNVRDNIINNAQVSPSSLPYKVFIIDEAHMLSLSAFNALLKTLEEPPKRIVFILATTEIHKLPATIISRCQRFDFKKVSTKDIVGKLQKITEQEKIMVDLTVLERIAKNSEGCARDAETLLGQILALDDKHVTAEQAELVMPTTQLALLIEFFQLLAVKNIKDAILFVNKMVEDGVDLLDFNKNFIEFLRKLLLYKIMGQLSDFENIDINKESFTTINEALEKISITGLTRMITVFLEKNEQLKNCLIAQLPLELAIIELGVEPENIPTVVTKKKALPSAMPALTLKKKSPVTEISEPKIVASAADQEILASVKQKMPQIIKALRVKNHSLALTFSIAQIVAFSNNNKLTIGVKYKFHHDRLCEAENLVMLEEVLSKEMGRPVKVACLVDDKYETNNLLTKSEQSDNLDNVSETDVKNVWDLAANTFGSDS